MLSEAYPFAMSRSKGERSYPSLLAFFFLSS